MFGILTAQQINIPIDGRFRSLGFQSTQHFPILQCYHRWDSCNLFHIDFPITLSNELGSSIAYAIDIDGENAHRACRNGQSWEFHTASLQLHILLSRQILQSLIVVDENESAVALRAIRPAKLRVISLGNILRRGKCCFHRSQRFSPILHEEVEFTEHEVVRIILAEFSEWCLEVVGLDRQIVVIGSHCALRLIHPSRTLGICSSMIHIVAQQIRATAQLHQGHRIGILRIEIGTTMISSHHATSQFTGKIGIKFIARIKFLALFSKLFGGNGRRRPERFEVESLVVVAGSFFNRTFPETVSIIAIERQHLSIRDRRSQFRPTCSGIERQIEANLLGNPFQGHQI